MLVVNPRYEDVTEAWFDPGYWGPLARPVEAGGRGSAWFLSTDWGDLVLRHYRRGGFMAKLSERRYLYTGKSRTRSFREFQLLTSLHDQGLPVPEPVAAWADREGLWYHAAILIRRIPGAVPLPEVENLEDTSLWREVGRIIRRFHDAGLDHADLNCDNILVAGSDVYLIDFDRCELRKSVAGAKKWENSNLDRLYRSVCKRCGSLSSKTRQKLWLCLNSAYSRR